MSSVVFERRKESENDEDATFVGRPKPKDSGCW
jgi:hypothetical protein